MQLYDYYRSTASYRVRIALGLKELDFNAVDINLIKNGGEQHSPMYLTLNPQGLVPSLKTDESHVLTQSLAIIEYINDLHPNPPLLPQSPWQKAEVRSLALLIACDMHPLNNLRVLTYLRHHFAADEPTITQWYHHWLKLGFDAFEKKLQQFPRKHAVCYGDSISLADIVLIPQMFNANRFGFALDAYPLLLSIQEYCQSLPAFQKAAP